MDKLNALVGLELNEGNVLKTAKEFGLARQTLINWKNQLESDLHLLRQVEAAKANLAALEELSALKANSEINRRLDERPDKISTKDLVSIKDAGIKNSRLIRGESTANVAHNTEDIADRYKAHLLSQGFTDDEVKLALAQPLQLPSGDVIEAEVLSGE